MEISHTIINLIIFVLAIYVGYHVVWTVTPALHTPLMAVTNAISAIIIVGAMLAAGLTEGMLGQVAGTVAVALAAVNVFGGFLVTQRMLEMFRKKEPKAKRGRQGMNFISMNLVTLLYLVASVCFIQALKGLSSPSTARTGNTFGMTGMAIAAVTTVALILKLKAEIGHRHGMGYGLVIVGLVVGGAHRRLRGQEGRDDQDAGTGRGDALADRPGRGLHRGGRGVGAVGLQHRRRAATRCRSVTGSNCSSAPSSAR